LIERRRDPDDLDSLPVGYGRMTAVHCDWPRKRIYLFGRRVHHGLTGAVFVAVGLGLMWHDRADRWWRATVG
jgi:hypothetical protein